MDGFKSAFVNSVILAEKIANDATVDAGLREKLAMADFAAFGLFKRASWDALGNAAAWGVGLGVPAALVGHSLLSSAHHRGEDLIREARNQALLTAAGIEGIGALGRALSPGEEPPLIRHDVDVGAPPPEMEFPATKIAAAILIDDILEEAYDRLTDPSEKHAALLTLIKHRGDAVHMLRGIAL